MKTRMKILAMAGLLLAMSETSAADDPFITVNGFGSAYVTRTDTDKAEFLRTRQFSGATTSWRTGVDSNLGLQIRADINDWLSLTGQGVAHKVVYDRWGVETKWAFAKAKVSDNWSVSVGRVGFPAFFISEYRDVGYAHTLVRPPAEMYNVVPVDYTDGIDVSWRGQAGQAALTAQVTAGTSKTDFNRGTHIDAYEVDDIVAFNVMAELNWLTVRFGHATSKVTLDNSPPLMGLLDILRGSGNEDIADRAALDKTKATFTSIGLTADINNFVLQTEIGKRKSDSFLVFTTTNWYLVTGYRFGKVLPFVSYASMRQKSPRHVPLTYPAPDFGAALQAWVDMGANGPAQVAYSAGVRWDFAKSAALKVQVDLLRPKEGTIGLFSYSNTIKPGFDGRAAVVAVGVDFVF